MKLDLGSVRVYLFELRLGSWVKPKARARINSARAILRTISNELKKLGSSSLQYRLNDPKLGSPMLLV
ncbi:hypothetical protein Hanom_Chr12g01096601 [Helianthus anomalus]